jgi:GNAT superfamily N-acetyltransferase
MSIRELQLADLEQLLTLYAELHQGDDPLPERARVEAIWGGMVRDPAQIHLGAFRDGALASTCSATVIANLTRGARPYALIENVVTLARFRRSGLGSAVMKRLIEACWDRGCYKIMLMSALRRSEIYGFYEALGFDRGSKQAFVIAAPRRP